MIWITIAAVSGALGVATGALGSHILEARLDADMLSAWNTAVLYHLLHSVILLALGFFSISSQRGVHLQAGLFSAGILLFSGSLYALALSGPSALGPLTPLGGLCLISGWLSLLSLLRRADPTDRIRGRATE